MSGNLASVSSPPPYQANEVIGVQRQANVLPPPYQEGVSPPPPYFPITNGHMHICDLETRNIWYRARLLDSYDMFKRLRIFAMCMTTIASLLFVYTFVITVYVAELSQRLAVCESNGFDRIESYTGINVNSSLSNNTISN